MKKFLNDLTFTAASSGVIAVLVGYLSSAALVYQLAAQFGLNSVLASQWIGVLCVAMGVLTIGLSWVKKMPIMFAWSTPGVAVLLAGLQGQTVEQAVGIFVVSSALTILIGISGHFDKLMKMIPLEVSSALIAGILLKFCISAFNAVPEYPIIIGSMVFTYILSRKGKPFFAVPLSLFVGLLSLGATRGIQLGNIDFHLYLPTLWVPAFSWQDAIGLALPLCLVTMTSQNVTGYAVLKNNGYDVSGSKLITAAGFTNLLIAPMGGFSMNLSSLTAALIAGPNGDPDKSKRYTGAIVSGVIYVVMGLFASAFGGLMGVIPPAMVIAIGGLALIGVVSSNLEVAIKNSNKEAAFLTFLISASQLQFFGISSAFWGLSVGVLMHYLFKSKRESK